MTENELQMHLKSGEIKFGQYRVPCERIVCQDGFSLSVQASNSHYCNPRNNDGPYHTVEVGFPSEKVEEFMSFCEDSENPTRTVYAQVPVEVVLNVINNHGGKVNI